MVIGNLIISRTGQSLGPGKSIQVQEWLTSVMSPEFIQRCTGVGMVMTESDLSE